MQQVSRDTSVGLGHWNSHSWMELRAGSLPSDRDDNKK